MKTSIKTTGDLRTYLANTMVSVTVGEISPENAGRIAKLAAQINESMYVEIKQQKLIVELGKAVDDFGRTLIGKED
jgi:hypothetical protein